MLDVVRTTVGELQRRLAERTGPVIVELDLRDPPVERAPDNPLARLTAPRRAELRTVVEDLDRASRSDRVAGLFATVAPGIPTTVAEELRAAVDRFRRSGRPAVVWAPSLGEVGGGTAAYWLATAFDEIHLQPSGVLGLVGLAAQVPFVADALERIGVSVQVRARHEYKTAPNTFTERDLTPAHRESLEGLLESWFGTIVSDIASARGLPEARVRELIDAAPLSAQAAREAGLIDGLSYHGDALAALRQLVALDTGDPTADAGPPPSGPPMVFLDRWRRQHRRIRPPAPRATVALVRGSGPIIDGPHRPGLGAAPVFAADAVARAIRTATADGVDALVLRVDSPGGSYTASDTVWREMVAARERGVRTVVSMGSAAASGGYFVAAPAERIVAGATTLTGSIGVFGGKPVVTGLLERLGVHLATLTRGRAADMASAARPFDAAELERFEAWLDRAYADFVSRVAEGRSMDPDEVERVARGRVWTGADALRRGLVDRLGGWRETLEEVRGLLGLDPDAPLRIRHYPHTTPLHALGLVSPPSSERDVAATGPVAALADGVVATVVDRLPPPAGDLVRILGGGTPGGLGLPGVPGVLWSPEVALLTAR